MDNHFNLIKQKYNNQTAIITEDGKMYTYGDFENKLEKFLKAVEGRCLLFIVCSNTVGSLLGYTACLHNGIVPLLLPESTSEDAIASLMETYKPKYVWIPDSRNTGKRLPSVFQMDGYKLLDTKEGNPYDLHESLALLLTTSGTTGSKKLVRQSYQNIRSNTESIVKYLDIGAKQKAVMTLPMSYTYGLSVIHTHLYMGATILLTNYKIVQRQFWDFVREYGATSIAGVPLLYETLWRMNFAKMNVPSLETLTQAGGRISKEVHRYFAEYSIKTNRRFYVMYGQTEATARISYLPYEESIKKIGSVGIPISGGRWWLEDGDGRKVTGCRQTGEIVYEGANVALGYANQGEDLAKGDEWKGVLYTGDVGYMDEDGYCYITGRKDRYAKVYGNRVNLDEVEGIVHTFTSKHTPCIERNNHIYIYSDVKMDETGLLELLVGKMKLPRSVFQFIRVENLPRSSSGKLDYKALEGVMRKSKG